MKRISWRSHYQAPAHKEGALDVAFWDPVVSPASNSILPEPGNQGPLSVLLDSTADSVTWTMGFADSAGPISVDFFSATGGLVAAVPEPLVSGYSVYTFSGLGSFQGFTIFGDNDPDGLRFQNFSYDSVGRSQTPEPCSLLLGTGLMSLAVGACRRVAQQPTPSSAAPAFEIYEDHPATP